VDIILTGKPEVKRPFRRPRRIWRIILKKDVREIGFMVMGLIHLAQDRDGWWAHVNIVMNLKDSM
jgi:hypothetical protein